MTKTLKEFQAEMAHNRRIRQQALAVLRRAEEAGISKQNMRIDKKQFRPLLKDDFFGGKEFADQLTSFIYDTPMKLIQKPFIVIDGGDFYERKKAGCAVLFRLISCDKTGLQESATTLSRNFQTFMTDGVGRNDYLLNLLNPDILFVTDFHSGLLRTEALNGGDFFDDLFLKREEEEKVTIISFQNQLPGPNIVGSPNELSDMRFGQYLCMLSKADMVKRNNILRIRVKINE